MAKKNLAFKLEREVNLPDQQLLESEISALSNSVCLSDSTLRKVWIILH